MKKFREKSEIWFAVVHIIAYVVLLGNADKVSESLRTRKCVTLPVVVLLSAVVFSFVKKNGLMQYYGLCRGSRDLRACLYFLPVILFSTRNFWCGVTLNVTLLETILYAASMLFVGFLEELIFRGYLFKAMCRNNVRTAVIVSSVTFGLGHIVNLLNGSELIPTLMQVVYAMAIGFAFTMIFLRTGSILPCILSHAFLNSTSVVGVEAPMAVRIPLNLVVTVLAGGYAVYLARAVKGGEETASEPGQQAGES